MNENENPFAEFDDQYEEIEVGDQNTLDEGKYTLLINGKLNQTRDGNPAIIWECRVLGPNHVGLEFSLWRAFDPEKPDTIKWRKKELDLLGIKCKPSEFAENIALFQNLQVECTAKKNDQYTNIYFNKLIEDPSAVDEQQQFPADSEVPF